MVDWIYHCWQSTIVGLPGEISNFNLSRMFQMALWDFKIICSTAVMHTKYCSWNERNSNKTWVVLWDYLFRLQNLRSASLFLHTNAPHNVMENCEILDSNKRIKQKNMKMGKLSLRRMVWEWKIPCIEVRVHESKDVLNINHF